VLPAGGWGVGPVPDVVIVAKAVALSFIGAVQVASMPVVPVGGHQQSVVVIPGGAGAELVVGIAIGVHPIEQVVVAVSASERVPAIGKVQVGAGLRSHRRRPSQRNQHGQDRTKHYEPPANRQRELQLHVGHKPCLSSCAVVCTFL
jgi:hypothetical protein